MSIRTLGSVIASCLLSVTASAWAADAPAPDYTKRVAELAKKLADSSAEIRQDGEIGLELLPPEAFAAMQAAADDQSLDPAARQRLRTIVERERPWQKPRIRNIAIAKQNNEWMKKTALDAYDRLAKHDLRWDEAARDGIRQFTTVSHAAARMALHKAVDAGCDDPLILYMAAASMMTDGQPTKEEGELYERARGPLLAGDYPAFYKICLSVDGFIIEYRLMSLDVHAKHRETLDDRMQHVLRQWIGQELLQWPRFVKEQPPASLLLIEANEILDSHRAWHDDLEPVYNRIAPYLETVLPNSPYPLDFKGNFYVDWGWQARGDGTADTVTEQGWKLLHERLAIAHAALQKAYDLDPTDPEAATLMLNVELGEGNGRDFMETWFKRAMAADPDNLTACYSKLNYLQPKWYGSEDEMVQFGRECYASGNWFGRIPLTLAEAHIEQGAYHTNNVDAFYAEPEVWGDFQRVYEPYLRVNPQDSGVRSDYAYLACRAGHWDVARRHFKILGDNVKLSFYMFYNPTFVKEFREKAEHDGHVRGAPTTSPSSSLPAGANSSGQ